MRSTIAFVLLLPATVAAKPLPAPALFGPGTVSTRDYERDGTFTPDGRSFYFTKRTIWPGFSAICVSHLARGRWSTPEVAPFSGQYPDAMPFVSPDGGQLYYASRRPATGSERKRDYDLYVVERDRDAAGWGPPRRLDVSTPANDFSPSLTRDGTLYFITGADASRVVRASRKGDGWDTPVAVPVENDGGAQLAAWVDPDERAMLVAIIGRPDALRSTEGLYDRADLYVRTRKDGVWSPLRHLPAPINSAADDLSPSLSPDGKTLLFTSERGVFTEHDRKLDYRAFERGLHDAGNGLGDIYQVPSSAAGLP